MANAMIASVTACHSIVHLVTLEGGGLGGFLEPRVHVGVFSFGTERNREENNAPEASLHLLQGIDAMRPEATVL